MNQLIADVNANQPLDETAELGFGTLLVAEDEEGGYEPVGVVSTVREAREIAIEDFRFRMADVENGKDRLCPYRYAIWVRRLAGYAVLTVIEPA